MTVSVTEAKNRLTQLLVTVEKGERVTIARYGRIIAEIAKPAQRKTPMFGTLRNIVCMAPEQFEAATRPMTDQEAEAFLAGRY